MADEEKSRLYKLKPLIDRMPAVKQPEGHVHFRRKMVWLILVLVIYLVMTNVMIYGLSQEQSIDLFEQFRAIFAGEMGSIVHLGITPIVNASIIMQLFQGAEIVDLDMKDEEDQAVFQNTQKFLVIIMLIIQAVPQVYGYLVPAESFISVLGTYFAGRGLLVARILIILQLFIGGYFIFLMDEVVSKWGIGSGISLFIVAGVSKGLFTGLFNWESAPRMEGNVPAGTIPRTIYTIRHHSASELAGGELEGLIIGPPNPVMGLIFTILILLIVAYIQGSRIELPLAHGRARGARGRYPIKLIYASVIPIILAHALLANINLFSMLFYTNPTFKNFPLLGGQDWLGVFQRGSTDPISGAIWYLNAPEGIQEWLLPLISERYEGALSPKGVSWSHSKLEMIARVIGHMTFMAITCVLFAKFWVQTTNMDAESVADQIQDSGMQIPGFRRDPRVLRRVLKRYIPTVTIFSGLFIGIVGAGSNLLGSVGGATGISLFLAVSILTELYEQIGKEQMMEMHPMLRDFFGNQ
ncbi:MAG: preprotein translocase subunit SecY [Candidatus Thermoplasmatota archaeon]|nr:preprotein translocase subunit SecY [Candidatus Thermoplasmatota archaeon]MBS3789851.1 preprotein translocase subunit SecY [Candidatus Thermoplasmatota archaeon]